MKQQLGKNAQGYTVSELHAKGKDLPLLVSLSDKKGSEQLLDVATGTGHTVNAFAPYVA
ncbi:hypothetical protein [Bacillus sp. FJAT-44742]|uniref:hypothetical protein n=1 Tax=Bacillus sp. FJAT-44742 TaxID=2014005 RepID=UPI0012FEEFBB|nr:hypothetical protein [Bacillus sp. FJAT-44742]